MFNKIALSYYLVVIRLLLVILTSLLLFLQKISAQCGPNTPTFTVDLSSNPDSAWISADTLRNDTCCGATAPDKCVAFELTLSNDAQGILFDVCDGALPPGALFYQVGCGPPTAVGEVLCLNGVGPHFITFCKPGNNNNKYCITSIPDASAGPDLAVNDGCIDTLSAVGFSDTSITWTSVFPGPVGAYDTSLSCSQDCDTTIISGGNNYPTFIDYQVCGYPIGGCGTTLICDTTRVYFYNTLEVDITPLNPTVCFGQSNTWIKANPTGGSPPYNFNWSTGETTDSIQVGVGTYIIELSDTSGCPATFDTVTVTEFLNPITANAGSDDTACIQNLPINLNGSVVAASGGVWSGGNGTFNPNDTALIASYTPTATEISAGSVDLILTTTGNGSCPPDTDTLTINIVDFTASINLTIDDVSCNGGSDGSATVNMGNGNPPFTYLWDANAASQTSPTATNLAAGSYVVTITNSFGCTDTAVAIINEPPLLVATISATTNVSCNGGSDGTATVTANGGTIPYTYSWPSGGTNPTETNLSAGSFIVTVTDNNGCTDTAIAVINEPPLLVASITATTNVSCNGGSDGTATVTANGGTIPYTYSWPSGGTNPTETNLAAGSFIVTVTDNKGCTDTAVAVINEPPLLVATITATTNVSCNGGSDGTATVTANGGTTPYTYSWPSGGTNPTETNLATGSFIVTVTDNKGCTDTAIAVINEPPLLVASNTATTNVSCNGGSNGTATVTANGGTIPYTYSWPSGGTNPTETNLAAGSFIVTVTDNNGCTDTAVAVINEPPLLVATITATTNVFCNGGSDGTATVTANGGTIPYTYSWPSGGANPTETNLAAGSFIVTVTDNNGCTDTAIAVINEPPLLIATITATTNVSCNGRSDGTATVTANGGTIPYTYSWPSGATNPTETNLIAGSFIVTVTDNNGCTDTAIAVINEPSLLISSISSTTDVSCFNGNDGVAVAIGQGGVAPYSFSWPSSNTNAVETNLAAGSYIVTITDNNGCTSTSTATINQPSALVINANINDVNCNGNDDGSIQANISGGTPVYTYLWSNSSVASNIANLSPTTYGLTITDNNGCQIDSNFSIAEPQPLTLSVSANDTICLGNSFTISANANGGNGNYTYNWNQGLGFGGSKNVSPNQTTTYTVTANDSKGCTVTPASVTVYVRDLNSDFLEASKGGDICLGESTTLFATHDGDLGPYTYTWNSLGSGLGPFTVTPNNTRNYIINVTDRCGVTITDTVEVIVHPFPNINLPDTIAIGCSPLSVRFTDSLNQNTQNLIYQWTFGNGESSEGAPINYTYQNPGTYQVNLSVTNVYGCEANSNAGGLVYVKPSPTANFNASTYSTPITESNIQFTNTSNGATYWEWDFGFQKDTLSNSIQVNYPDTGTYIVKLNAINQFGCPDSIIREVRINPVYDFEIPNAFTPDPNGSNGGQYNPNGLNNDVFFVYADYVREFHMMIFNRWGELIFESFDLHKGWDGYYRDKLCQQDVYVYKVEITWTDGSETVEAGDITLFR